MTKKIMVIVLSAVACSLFGATECKPIYQTPGEIEILRAKTEMSTRTVKGGTLIIPDGADAGKHRLHSVKGGTFVVPDGPTRREVIAKGVAFNVRVEKDADGKGVSLVFLDQYGKPFKDQEKWAKLATGSPLPISTQMFFSDGCPNIETYATSMLVWQVTSINYGTYWETTYRTGFSGNAPYFTHGFIANGSYTLTANMSGPMSINVNSDDNATLSVDGIASCASSLDNPGGAIGAFPSGTNSAVINWSYENIGGPHFVNLEIVVRRN